METDLTEESRVAAFARKAASWLDGLNEVAKSSSQSTPALFAERFPLTEGTRAKMLEIVPWDSDHGYTSMLRHPRGKCKGVLHIAFPTQQRLYEHMNALHEAVPEKP